VIEIKTITINSELVENLWTVNATDFSLLGLEGGDKSQM
jgi:hypothetical protein